VHAKREDISLRQDEINLRMRKERIFHCTKRCICSCAKRGYFIAPRGDVSVHAQKGFVLVQKKMFLRMCQICYFITLRGDVAAHAQR
jgi:hypothetical protein